MIAETMAAQLARRLRNIMGEFNDDEVGVEILVLQLTDYRRAHLTQPAQSVDVEKVREVIATLYEWPVCADPTELADKLTAALQEKGK